MNQNNNGGHRRVGVLGEFIIAALWVAGMILFIAAQPWVSKVIEVTK